MTSRAKGPKPQRGYKPYRSESRSRRRAAARTAGAPAQASERPAGPDPRRRRLVRAGLAVTVPALALALAATSQTGATPEPSEPSGDSVSALSAAGRGSLDAPGPDWAPAPASLAGLQTLATADRRGLRLLTADGARGFIAGVDLGVTTPGHQPGEVNIDAEEYRRWFEQMGSLGIRAVRIYTIHRPAFYTELLRYNESHPATPIYLVQGVYIPDETYLAGGTLYDHQVDTGFADELADAVRAVHGTLERDPLPGRASGHWTADVSPYLMSWIIGVEWDPDTTVRTDTEHADAPATRGLYFRSTPDATPTERWIAKHMNALAQLEAAQDRSMPIAFVNWPTTDPLRHPEEPHPGEDMVGVDANHVLPTTAWPGGTYASYHAYPYYPDFLRYEPGLNVEQTSGPAEGTVDPYAGYLAALKKHHSSMPVLITELGVPSSLGSAHNGPLGRDQGGHTEQEAASIDAQLLRLVKGEGLSGAFLFAWTDEWFKFTWNTIEHQTPRERRQLWHDPLTNEQYFGLLAEDPARLPDVRTEQVPDGGKVARLTMDADPSYVYVDVTYAAGAPREPLVLSVDTVPGGTGVAGDGGSDYRVEIDPRAGSGRALVRAALDPDRLDTWEDLSEAGAPWHLYRLITNRSYGGVKDSTMEYQDVGALVRGTWDPASPRYNSLATWRIDGDTVRMRIPWPMLGLSDPSSRTALGEGDPVTTHTVDGDRGLVLSLSIGGGVPYRTSFTWPTWNSVKYTERLKTGLGAVKVAFETLND